MITEMSDNLKLGLSNDYKHTTRSPYQISCDTTWHFLMFLFAPAEAMQYVYLNDFKFSPVHSDVASTGQDALLGWTAKLMARSSIHLIPAMCRKESFQLHSTPDLMKAVRCWQHIAWSDWFIAFSKLYFQIPNNFHNSFLACSTLCI